MEPKNLVTALTIITLVGQSFEKHPMYPENNPPVFVAPRHEGQHSPHSEKEQQYPIRNAQGVAYVYGKIDMNAGCYDKVPRVAGFPTMGIMFKDL